MDPINDEHARQRRTGEPVVPGSDGLPCRNGQCRIVFENNRFGADLRQQHEDLDHGQQFIPNP
jgi:hypothetical protein